MYTQKMRLIPSLEDILLHSSVNWNSPDHKNHKLFKEKGFENYRGRVRIDNVIFNTIVRVGKAKFGDIFYDINLEVDSYLPHTNNSASDINEPTSMNSIPETSEKSNSFSKNSLEKSSNLEKDEIDNYTEEQYNNFGWARANGVLSARENERLRSLFADAVSKQSNPPKTKSGEYMIAIGEDVDNKIAYMTGEIDNSVITRVLEIDEYNETKLDEKRRNVYEAGRRVIQPPSSGVYRFHYSTDYRYRRNKQGSRFESERYNDGLGANRGRGGKTTSRVKEILFDDDGNEISRSYRKESKLERDEITVRDMLATNLDELAVTKTEKKRIAEYRGRLDEQSKYLEEIDKLRAELWELRQHKSDRDIEQKKKDIRAKIKALCLGLTIFVKYRIMLSNINNIILKVG